MTKAELSLRLVAAIRKHGAPEVLRRLETVPVPPAREREQRRWAAVTGPRLVPIQDQAGLCRKTEEGVLLCGAFVRKQCCGECPRRVRVDLR